MLKFKPASGDGLDGAGRGMCLRRVDRQSGGAHAQSGDEITAVQFVGHGKNSFATKISIVMLYIQI